MEMEKRKVSDSIVETVHMVRPQHLNASDRLFGGALMQWIDEVAGMVAKRHTRRNVITASVGTLNVFDILKYNTVVLDKAAVAKVEEVYA